MEVDWAGGTLTYVDTHTGNQSRHIFLSQYSQQATIHLFTLTGIQKIQNWIDGHVRAYEYFGGVPEFTIPDNTKTAVIKPDRIDPC